MLKIVIREANGKTSSIKGFADLYKARDYITGFIRVRRNSDDWEEVSENHWVNKKNNASFSIVEDA